LEETLYISSLETIAFMKRVKSILFFLFIYSFTFGQSDGILKYLEKIDSLNSVYAKTLDKEKKLKIKLLIVDKYTEIIRSSDSLKILKSDIAEKEVVEALGLAGKMRNKFYEAEVYYHYYLFLRENGRVDEAIENAQLAIKQYQKSDSLTKVGLIYLNLGGLYETKGELRKSIKYLNLAVQASSTAKDTLNLLDIYHTMGVNYYYLGLYDSSLYVFKTNYDISVLYNDTALLSRSLNTLGTIYYARGRYTEAITYALESLKLSEALKNNERISSSLINAANIYKAMNSDSLALDFYFQALDKIPEDRRDYLSSTFNNIGIIYENQNRLRLAKQNYEKALVISIEEGDEQKMMAKYINLGSVSVKQKQYMEAINYYTNALNIAVKRDDKKRIAQININIAELNIYQKRANMAIRELVKADQIAKEFGFREIQKQVYHKLSEAYKIKGNFETSLDYYEKYASTKDSLLNDDTQKAFADMQTKYDTEKKQQENNLLKKENALQELKSKRDDLIKIVFAVGSIFLLAFLIFAFRQIRIIRKKNYLLAERNYEIQFQKEEIEMQRDEIGRQRDIVVKQKEEITDSIYYARRIQKAVLPHDTYVESVVPEHFVLFRPRDIVSGDFYWIRKIGNKLITIAADCTGHGVPGAFMSMLGVSFLNEIITQAHIPDAHVILNKLRNSVKTTLDQTGKADEAKDGMDIALTIIDFDAMELQYAGAYNPLYFYRDGELIEKKADKMPIGIYIKEKDSFTKHAIPIQKGDTFYIFSDGYVDQFGGEKKRKFMAKPFKKMLGEIQDKSMNEQKEILHKTLENWRGPNDQVDDIIVVGVRI